MSNVGKPTGLLHPKIGETKFDLSMHAPAHNLSFFVQHFWIVSWDLRGQAPYISQTLPHPSVHLSIEKGQSRIVGVVRGKFTYLLEGAGRVFGVRFRPGAFYPFVKKPISHFTDRSLNLSDFFGAEESKWLEEAILAGPIVNKLTTEEKARMIAIMEHFLRARLPEQDKHVVTVNMVIDTIIANRDILRIDNLVERTHITRRTLQRLFHQYVGVSPKWVIKRYRLHEAAELLDRGEGVDLPQLALSLGYFDQAHFINDFKTIVGETPGDYANRSES